MVDRYYTPPAIADLVVEATGAVTMSVCVDSTCGSGNLLRASRAAFPRVHCVGLDSDESAIELLRATQPNWSLTVGDLLRPRSWESSGLLDRAKGCDYVVINPPFSMGARSSFRGTWRGESFSCSLAMRYMLCTLRSFAPTMGGAAVVPESLLHSEMDSQARRMLAADYAFDPVRELSNTTFRGTRANAAIVSLKKRETPLPLPRRAGPSDPPCLSDIRIVRGGVQMFAACDADDGALLVHSTDLRSLATTGPSALSRRVRSIGRGTVEGHVVLLPRVGVPHREAITSTWFRRTVQPSDCVIALRTSDGESARRLADAVRRKHVGLCAEYRGTGARYVTVSRLGRWLAESIDRGELGRDGVGGGLGAPPDVS